MTSGGGTCFNDYYVTVLDFAESSKLDGRQWKGIGIPPEPGATAVVAPIDRAQTLDCVFWSNLGFRYLLQLSADNVVATRSCIIEPNEKGRCKTMQASGVPYKSLWKLQPNFILMHPEQTLG